jgi:hypothetical protein
MRRAVNYLCLLASDDAVAGKGAAACSRECDRIEAAYVIVICRVFVLEEVSWCPVRPVTLAVDLPFRARRGSTE